MIDTVTHSAKGNGTNLKNLILTTLGNGIVILILHKAMLY